MALNNFFKLLLRYKWVLIVVPIITVAITYFLVRNLPDLFRSRSRLATGLVERQDAILNNNTADSKINQEFNNIIERMLQKRTVTQVSYLLLLRNLTDKAPFRPNSELVNTLSPAEKEKLVALLNRKYTDRKELDVTNADEKKLQELLESMHYDEASIKKELIVFRSNMSDFIDMQFDSDSPFLAAFVLNNLSNEFISDYTNNLNENKNKTIAYLDSMMTKKHDELIGRMRQLQAFKSKTGILDVDNQANILIGQIAEFESKRQESQKNISAYQGALKNIDNHFDPNDRRYSESAVTGLNQDILAIRNRLSAVNDDYVRSNFNPSVKAKADSLQALLAEKINQTSDKVAYSPMSSKKDLIKEKMNLELSLSLAENSVSSDSLELSRLRSRLYALVPNQAQIATLQDDIAIYNKEYNDLYNKYNQAVLDGNFTTKLKQIEMAMPGVKQPSKKMLLVVLSGLISFVFCLVVFFVLFFFDNSITTAKELANKTKLPVLGNINRIEQNALDFESLWAKKPVNPTPDLLQFKSLLRSIRFEMDQQLGTNKIVTLTSVYDKTGKTFLALNLAYAYKKVNKKVVVIDGNFEDPELTSMTGTKRFLEDYLSSEKVAADSFADDIVVLGNKGSDLSLFEVANQNTVKAKLDLLKETFDVIIIDAPSLSTDNRVKEWMGVTENVIPVYAAGHTIKGAAAQDVDYLAHLDEKVIGWILNKTPTDKNFRAKELTTKKSAVA